MSSLGVSEFEGTLWNEFFWIDDRIPPHDGLERSNHQLWQHDSSRNTPCEGNCNSSHSENGSVSRYANSGSEQGGYSIPLDRCSGMSETDSSTCKQSAVSPCTSESDLIKETSSVAFDNTRSSHHEFNADKITEFSVADTYLGDRSTSVENYFELTQQGSSFNSSENVDSNDIFSDVWPDIQSFEDVEKMFRSSDFTFGIGGNEEDALSGLSSGNDKGGLKFEFSCPMSSTDVTISEEGGSSKSYLVDSSTASAHIKFKDSPCTSESDSVIPFVNEPTMADNEFIPGDEVREHKMLFKLLNQPKRSRKEHNSGNGSHRYLGNFPIEFNQIPSAQLQQTKQPLELRKHISDIPSSDIPLPNPTSVNQPPSGVKDSVFAFHSLREFPKESSQLQSVESSHDLPSPVTSLAGVEKTGRPDGNQEKQVHLSGNKPEDPIDADRASLVNTVELGSSVVRESSKRSFNDISPEAASFCQLQLVMEWLDFRTKLCIRDGLYRLAQGAKQRHNHARPCDGKTSSGLFDTEGINKCDEFSNMETGTNPVDRSIARLLFHRPVDLCGVSARNA